MATRRLQMINTPPSPSIPFHPSQPPFRRRRRDPLNRVCTKLAFPTSPPRNLGRLLAARLVYGACSRVGRRAVEENEGTMLRAAHLRMSPAAPAAPSSRDGEARACYGIVVACVSLLLLCALVSAVGVVRAFAATGVLVLLLGLAGWLAPTDAFAVALAPALSAGNASGGGTARPAPAVRLQVSRCASCGLAAQAIDALPTFAYEPPAADVEDSGEKQRGGGALCAVCLEDVVAGETVRRLPSCGHLFHVDCIDMWLHAHRTCPLCRCDLSPGKFTAKSSSAAAAAATTVSVDVLPPV